MKTPPLNMTKYPFVILPGGDCVELRRREWMLLNYLLEHRGEMMTAFQIYRDVWRLPPAVIRLKNNSAIFTCLTRVTTAIPDVIIAKVQNRGWALL